MSRAFQEVAESQDEIGWGKFLYGKVSKKICTLQGAHCILAGTSNNGNIGMKQFVQQLVEISPAQWLYHNFTLHHHVKGYLRQRTVNKISQEVELLTNTQQLDVPQESRYLLEIPQQPLLSLLPIHNAYWVLAMKATKTKLRRNEEDLARQGTRSGHREKQPSCNLLDGVQESLHNRLFPQEQGIKRRLAKAQASASARPAHQQQWGRTPLSCQGGKTNHRAVKPNHPSPCKQACQENSTLQENDKGPHKKNR
jgi:hypothetical protein